MNANIIAIANQKGGVGKTTTCANLGMGLAREGKKVLNDTETIISKLDHYTEKVRWHIQRLYRIRNEITHSAFQENKSLMIYIEHLYTYLAQLISEVVYYVEHKQSESVEEAFATILESYNTYIELLKEGKIANQDVLPTGIGTI